MKGASCWKHQHPVDERSGSTTPTVAALGAEELCVVALRVNGGSGGTATMTANNGSSCGGGTATIVVNDEGGCSGL